jgi:pilus assembly protein Flp/PilA
MAIEPEPNLTLINHPIFPCGKESVMDQITKFTCDEAGATAVEYALLMAFIALAIISSVATLGTTVAGLFKDAADKFPGG